MKVTVLTSNQPRHLHLVNALAEVCDEVFAIQECSTLFPGEVEDFYKNSDLFKSYFSKVVEAEKNVFGDTVFTKKNVRSLVMKFGDLNRIPLEKFGPALESDFFIVFGTSYIKGALCDFLVEKRCLNIHMGVSPYYRGAATNFWPLFDRRPELVGATIHLLTKGLDSGPILFHALPQVEKISPFLLGMKSVRSAHLALVSSLRDNSLFEYKPNIQNKELEIRYTKKRDFDDDVIACYLDRVMTDEEVFKALEKREMKMFVNPHII